VVLKAVSKKARALDDVGRITVSKNAVLAWRSNWAEWEAYVADVCVVGERTTEEGPCLDWFVVFIGHDGAWWECPANALGMFDVLRNLGVYWGISLNLELMSCTCFKSRIVYPKAMVGVPLFDYRPVAARGVFGWLRNFGVVEVHLRDQVREFCRNSGKCILSQSGCTHPKPLNEGKP
jgi:hypothetical protein